jgi:hypothetical protein
MKGVFHTFRLCRKYDSLSFFNPSIVPDKPILNRITVSAGIATGAATVSFDRLPVAIESGVTDFTCTDELQENRIAVSMIRGIAFMNSYYP